MFCLVLSSNRDSAPLWVALAKQLHLPVLYSPQPENGNNYSLSFTGLLGGLI